MTSTPITLGLSARNLVDGEWIGDVTKDVRDPADESVVGRVASLSPAQARTAADAASTAFDTWSTTTGRERGDLLRRGADAIRRDAESIGELLCRETGKPLAEAVGEVRFAAEYFAWFSERARDPLGEQVASEIPARRAHTTRVPAGVAVCLTPWNFPVSIQARKIAAALAAGCTVVTRPSEKAPLAVTALIERLVDAGLPAGVLNLVHGDAAETTRALLDHPAVRVVSFTGSTAVGSLVMEQAAARIVRPALELGGDAPFIVFEDADLGEAVAGAMLAKFRNNGQSCIAANRFYVHESVFEPFLERFVHAVDALVPGDPRDASTTLGPLIDSVTANDYDALVKESASAGRLRTRRFDLPETGSFVAPALVTDLPDDAPLLHREVFGPAAAVVPFSDEDEVLRRANATEMGLAAYAYTRDVGRAARLAERLQAGIVGINVPLPSVVNAPMGGVKQSGLGREGGGLGMEEFSEVRYVAVGL